MGLEDEGGKMDNFPFVGILSISWFNILPQEKSRFIITKEW